MTSSEKYYAISKHLNIRDVLNCTVDEDNDYNEFINTLRLHPKLTYAVDTGMYKPSEKKYIDGTFYFQYSVKDRSNNHYSYIAINVNVCNKIVATHRGKENYDDLKVFLEVANLLKAHLWSYDGKGFIIDETYVNNLKEKESKVKLNDKQKIGFELLEFSNRWLLVKTIDFDFLDHLIANNKTEELFENCIEEVIEGNKLLMTSQEGWTLIMGSNLPYLFYSDKAEFDNTTDNNSKLIASLNHLSSLFAEAFYFEFHKKYGIAVSAKSTIGNLGYANFSFEGEVQEYFEESDSNKISINLNECSVIDLCKKWTGVTPEELIIDTIKKKQQVKTFKQESYLSFFN